MFLTYTLVKIPIDFSLLASFHWAFPLHILYEFKVFYAFKTGF